MAPASAPLSINLAESFEHLSHAPISEAVFQIRGRALTAWDEPVILPALKSRLPDYPKAESSHVQQLILNNKPSPPIDLGWSGAVLRSVDGLEVANFQRDSFSFSRLAPYQGWTRFSAEAFRLYAIHRELAQPADAHRIGLRFINQFAVPSEGFELSDYFNQPPSAHVGLALEPAVFFHQDTFRVPGHPYGVNVIRTLQPTVNLGGQLSSPKLILDIDVFTEIPSLIDIPQIHTRLQEMRWIKNKVFFGSLTASVINSFR